jgi:hypothetical protein
VDDRLPPLPLEVEVVNDMVVEAVSQQVVRGGSFDGIGPQGVEGVMVRDEAPAPRAKEGPCELAKTVPAAVKGKRTKTVVVKTNGLGRTTTRKSMRNRGAAATPTMAKAQQRAAERNLEKGNPFTVLDPLSDSHLSHVASDSCVVFTPSAGTPIEALSLIRAKERAQAALAEAAFRKEQAELERARSAGEAEQPVLGDGEGNPPAVPPARSDLAVEAGAAPSTEMASTSTCPTQRASGGGGWWWETC